MGRFTVLAISVETTWSIDGPVAVQFCMPVFLYVPVNIVGNEKCPS